MAKGMVKDRPLLFWGRCYDWLGGSMFARSGRVHSLSLILFSAALAVLVCSSAFAGGMGDLYKSAGAKYGELITRGGSVIPVKPPLPITIASPIVGLGVAIGLDYLLSVGEDAFHSLQVQAGAGNPPASQKPAGWVDADNPGTKTPVTATRYVYQYPSGTYWPGGGTQSASQGFVDRQAAAQDYFNRSAPAATEAYCTSQSPINSYHMKNLQWIGVQLVGSNYQLHMSFDCLDSHGNAVNPTQTHDYAGSAITSKTGPGCESYGDGWTYNSTDSLCHASGAAAMWSSDGMPSIRPTTAGGWEWNPHDPDNGGYSDPISNPIIINGVADTGERNQISITAQPGGGFDYQSALEDASTGKTQIDRFSVDPYGNVSNYTYTTINGPIQNAVTNTYVAPGTAAGQQQTPTADEWPAFCDWASTVCTWYQWATSPAEPPADPDLPTEDTSALISHWESGIGEGACPEPLSISYGGRSFDFSFQPACTAAGIIKPVLLALCAIGAALIIVGARAT